MLRSLLAVLGLTSTLLLAAPASAEPAPWTDEQIDYAMQIGPGICADLDQDASISAINRIALDISGSGWASEDAGVILALAIMLNCDADHGADLQAWIDRWTQPQPSPKLRQRAI